MGGGEGGGGGRGEGGGKNPCGISLTTSTYVGTLYSTTLDIS